MVFAKNSLARAKVSISDKTWTGKALKPAPVGKMGKKKLRAGTDYKLSYKNNKNVGVATVSGTRSVAFGERHARANLGAQGSFLLVVELPVS